MNRLILLAALALALILVALVVLAYVSQFGMERSTSQDVWGQFGDYFAGLLNPIFSLLAFVALLLSLVLQQDEAKKNHERFEAQYSIANKEFDDYLKEKLASELLAVVKDIDERLNNIRGVNISPPGAQNSITIALMVAEGNRIRHPPSQSDSYTNFIEVAREKGTIVEAIVRDLTDLVLQMRDVLSQFSEYRGSAQAPLIVYYANKTYPFITILEDIGAVDETTRKFFATVSDRHH